MSQEAIRLALNKAFQLGQRYWSWADSEYSSHWKKADAAKAEFDQLVQDTINAALAEQPAQQEPVAWATQLNEYAHIKWGAKRPEYPMVYEFALYTSPPPQRKSPTASRRTHD